MPHRYMLLRNPMYNIDDKPQKKLTDYGAEIPPVPTNGKNPPPPKTTEQHNNLLELYGIDVGTTTHSELEDATIRAYESILNAGIEYLSGYKWSAHVSLNCARSNLAFIQAQGGEFDLHTGDWVDVLEDDDAFSNLQKLYEHIGRMIVKERKEI